jgi:hypothetical protein
MIEETNLFDEATDHCLRCYYLGDNGSCEPKRELGDEKCFWYLDEETGIYEIKSEENK